MLDQFSQRSRFYDTPALACHNTNAVFVWRSWYTCTDERWVILKKKQEHITGIAKMTQYLPPKKRWTKISAPEVTEIVIQSEIPDKKVNREDRETTFNNESDPLMTSKCVIRSNNNIIPSSNIKHQSIGENKMISTSDNCKGLNDADGIKKSKI